MNTITMPVSMKKPLLLVEDEVEARQLFKEMLSLQNYNVQLARSGKNAINKIKKYDYGAVLMDIKMPGPFDGIEASIQIQKEKKQIPIYLLTAFTNEPEYVRRVKEANLRIEDWIDKPVAGENRELLFRSLHRVYKKAEARMNFEKFLNNRPSIHQVYTYLETMTMENNLKFSSDVLGDTEMFSGKPQPDLKDAFSYLSYLAFIEDRDRLIDDYPGEFVAYFRGEFVGHHPDQKVLLQMVYDKVQETSVYIQKLENEIPKTRIRGRFRVVQ